MCHPDSCTYPPGLAYIFALPSTLFLELCSSPLLQTTSPDNMTDRYPQAHSSHPVQENTALTSFIPFPNLPTELRFEIWKLAISADQRIFRCRREGRLFSLVRRTLYNACYESRRYYLMFYKLSMSSMSDIQQSSSDDTALGIDYTRNMILISLNDLVRAAPSHPLSRRR